MLPRLAATLAPLVAALAAAAAPSCRLHSVEGSASVEVFCLAEQQFRLRISHTADSPAAHSRLVVVCEPHHARPEDYEALFALGLHLGETRNVVLHQCPLPAGGLRDFLARLDVRGVRLVRVVSLALLNDTMPADFLTGVDLETLYLDGLTRIELHDDFFASTGGLHNLTMTGTNTTLPERLFRHTPHLRRLHVQKLNAGRLPPTLLHGLHNLTKLLAGRNGLRELTREHFRDLTRLRHLDLYKNELETLPADVFSPLTGLEVLRMECNPFRSLPEPLFAGTPRLKLLRINGQLRIGNVSSLPPRIFIGLDQLELLMLDRLGLRQLPAGLFRGLTALHNLTLDNNELTALPDHTFAELRGLLNLDLSGNRLRALSPDLLQGLERLDTLYLNGNGLTDLPAEMFTRTPRLGRLFLQDNNLTSLERLAFTGLDHSLKLLDLSNNSLLLDGQEPAFDAVRELRVLNLRDNRVRQVARTLTLNLLKLERLDLSYNQLQSLYISDLNFLSSGTDIRMDHNNISVIHLQFPSDTENEPNVIHIGDNPLTCDCRLFVLSQFVNRTRPSRHPEGAGPPFLLDTARLQCARPPPLAGRLFSSVPVDRLVCPLPEGCPTGCNCTRQPSRRTVIVSCAGLPRQPLPQLPDYALSLHVEGAGLRGMGNASWSDGQLASLHLGRNAISELTPALLPAGLRELRLENNNISRVAEAFLDLLDRKQNNVTRLWLGGNPFLCDCALLPLHHYLQLHLSGNTLRIMDADRMTCAGGERSSLLEMTSAELCPSHTATIVVVCVVAPAVAVCLLVALCVYYRHGEMLKVWLYSHNLCLWFVTEEELDADKKYDAFISYSHLDEQFVVEQLVPELERGEPKYSLCLHFRDWLAGEWITDQIQRSVQESRRVIVVMSQNFLQSEWGRLEFLAAHKQALEDKRNRVIVLVYGELPDPAAMGPELRLYISMNTYLQWGDALFWQRLRYALPHKGRRLKRSRGRQVSEKLGLVGLENGTSPPAAGASVTDVPAGNGVPADRAGAENGVGNGDARKVADHVV